MPFLVLILSTLGASADTNLSSAQVQQLSQRFVSTLRETQVDAQLTSVPEVQGCITRNRITEEDIQTPGRAARKREQAANCMRGLFANKSEADIQALSRQLQLESSGLVAGQSRKAITDYFSDRIERALYGMGASGESLRLKDQSLVDHRVYDELYKSQLGKNILLEISRFCLERLAPSSPANLKPGSSASIQRFSTLMRGGGLSFQQVIDTATAEAASSDPYTEVYNNLASLTNEDDRKFFLAGREGDENTREGGFFEQCAGLIKPMCEVRSRCDAPAASQGSYPQNIITFGCPNADYGKAACLVQAKLRAMRVNLTALDKTKEAYDAMRDNTGLDRMGRNGQGRVNTGEGMDDLSSLSTKDAKEALKGSEDELKAFDQAGCNDNSESEACRQFFNSSEERTRLANAGLANVAATEAERARIAKLSRQDLEKYLEDKGYADLLARLRDGSSNDQEVVALAQNRFTAEREAAFSSMESAFAERQASPGQNNGNTVREDIRNRTNDFNRLLLFNNVVSSYLTVSGREGTSKNTAALRREVEGMRQAGQVNETALQFFSNLSDSAGDAGGNTNSVTVDLGVVDMLLGKPRDRQAGTTSGAPAE